MFVDVFYLLDDSHGRNRVTIHHDGDVGISFAKATENIIPADVVDLVIRERELLMKEAQA
jgi:hypothetical protein